MSLPVEAAQSDLSSPLAAVNSNTKRRAVSEGRCASSHSLPDCWIADTGCGYDLLCGKWVTVPDKGKLSLISHPPTFSGVGGSMAAKMKLRLKSPALNSTVEPYVLPNTPDVISIGQRCVERGWYFWWPPLVYAPCPQSC